MIKTLLIILAFPIVGGIMSYIVGRYNKRYRIICHISNYSEFLVMISFINNMESFFNGRVLQGQECI